MKRRCLVPACGFYEWQKHPAGKQPYYITSVDGSLLAFAGLWDDWRKPDGEVLTTFTVLTCEPNELVRPLHGRMPVILEPDRYDEWLSADDPHELLVENQECERIRKQVLSIFEDDPVAQILTEGIIAELEGKELCELAGISAAELATKRRLIRRRINSAFPQGWHHDG